jgi:hypothetical protein
MTKELRKKRGRATTGQDQVTALRLPLELKSKVGAWANRQDDKPSLSEAIRRLVEKALAGTVPRQLSKGARKATEMAARELDRVLGDQPATGEERAHRKRRLLGSERVSRHAAEMMKPRAGQGPAAGGELRQAAEPVASTVARRNHSVIVTGLK